MTTKAIKEIQDQKQVQVSQMSQVSQVSKVLMVQKANSALVDSRPSQAGGRHVTRPQSPGQVQVLGPQCGQHCQGDEDYQDYRGQCATVGGVELT